MRGKIGCRILGLLLTGMLIFESVDFTSAAAETEIITENVISEQETMDNLCDKEDNTENRTAEKENMEETTIAERETVVETESEEQSEIEEYSTETVEETGVLENIASEEIAETGDVYTVCDEDETEEIVNESSGEVASGQCGDNLYWTLESGTLTISGTGDMWDFSAPDYDDNLNLRKSPFYGLDLKNTRLVFSGNITKIGSYAFYGCSNLIGDLIVPEGVTEIGAYAFNGCHELTGTLVIPEKVIQIGDSAFSSCHGFVGNLKIPKGLKIINKSSFSYCSGFTGCLEIPEGITTIDESAFEGCRGFSGDLIIPKGVTTIGSRAFYECRGFTGNLIMPKEMKTIGSRAFYGCGGFTGNLIIPEGVVSIGNWAFYNCYNFTGDLIIPKEITIIEEGTFRDCRGFTGNLFISERVSTIKESAFENCSGFKGNLTISKSVVTIGANSFYGCSGFCGNLILPEGITTIVASAFSACSGFEGNLIIPRGVTVIEESAFSGCSGFNGSLTIPEGVTSIEESAFENCSGFTGNLVIPDSVMTIGNYAFEYCSGFNENVVIGSAVTQMGYRSFSLFGGIGAPSGNLKGIYFKGNIIDEFNNGEYCGAFYKIRANGFYPKGNSGWEGLGERTNTATYPYADTYYITWYSYIEGTEPWNTQTSKDTPFILNLFSTNPEKLIYGENGFNALNLDMDISLLYMNMGTSDDNPIYENVKMTIDLSEGISFDKERQVQFISKLIGTMDSVKNQRIDLETIPIYVDPTIVSEEYEIVISIECDGYADKRISSYKIPVLIEQEDVDYTIIDAVSKYTSGDELKPILDILNSGDPVEEKRRKMFELFNCDNIYDMREQITFLKDSFVSGKEERWAYNGLINDDMYTSYQWHDYLNNTTKGKATRGALFVSGLVFNNELDAWLDISTYLDGDYPGVEKYQSMLEEFINEQSSDFEYYASLKATHKFIKNMVGTISSTEKAEFLKIIAETKTEDELKTLFNDIIADTFSIEDSSGNADVIVISASEKTPFMKAMGITGNVFKISNATMDTINTYINLEKNLASYEVNKAFLMEISDAKDLPWELRVAAYRLIVKYEEGYYQPLLEIVNKIRDECIDGALNGTKFDSVMGLGGYLAAIDFGSYCINQFVNVGALVVNSCQTEGYYFLAKHYADKLKTCRTNFLKDKSEENAWEFYTTYNYLWMLRIAGEKKFLDMNKLEGSKTFENAADLMGTSSIADVISECCGYSEKEICINEILDMLKGFSFKYNLIGVQIPEKYQYIQKIVVECPVTVNIYSPSGSVICALPDREEVEINNGYGKFITKYRETTGDYVKIGYFYNENIGTVNMVGQDSGKVECSIVTTKDHQECTIKGFDEVQISEKTVINVMVADEEYTIDQDGNGTIDIKASIVDKERIHVLFVYGEGQQSLTEYVNEQGYISMPKEPTKEGYIFGGWYTKDGGEGERFDGSERVQKNITVYAHWIDNDINDRQLVNPLANLESGSKVEKGTKIILTCEEKDADIYYTTDGSTPTQKSTLYTKPIEILEDTVIKAFASKEGYKDSEVVIFIYSVMASDQFENNEDGVLPEDIPATGIPEGLWISSIIDQTYTGKEIKPPVRVYDKDKRLKEGIDYTINYKNNIKVCDASVASKAPSIIVRGKGNYTGKETQTFVILPKDITSEDVMVNDIALNSNGKVQKSVPVVMWKGKKLANKKDFTVSYPDTGNGVYKENGTYKIVVKGIGNYTGSRELALTITANKLTSKLKISKIADQYYTGSKITPKPVVKDGRTVLTENVHYAVSYRNNTEVGTAALIVTGMGEYVGTKQATFKISAVASLNKANVLLMTNSGSSYSGGVYTGEEVRPNNYILMVVVKDKNGQNTAVLLKEGVDYKVSYQNNIKVGTATVFFTGINKYTGTLKKKYKISPYDFKADDNNIKISLNASYCYTKGGCKPKPVVTFGGKVLKEGADYTLKYKNYAAVNNGSNHSKMPTVVIKGKGNFKGSLAKTYQITKADLANLSLSATDRVWQNKTNIYKTKVVIKDIDGKPLSAGRDYDRNIVYTYNAVTTLADGTVKKAGTVVGAKDVIPADTIIGVTVNANQNGCYYGTISGTFRIVKADISKASIKIPTQIYTGKAIEPDNMIEVKINKQILSAENYEVVGYGNNINKGTATVIIKGKNDCGGVKTVKFRIKEKGFLWWWKK